MQKLLIFLALITLPLSLFAQEKVELQRESDDNPVILIKTNHGDIYAELFPKEAPKTVKTVVGLAEGKIEFTDKTGKKVKRPFYDGLIFHRVIKKFMIQGGCPKGTGAGGPGFQFKDEINAKSLGLDKIKAMEGRAPHPHLLIRSRQAFFRVIIGPLVRSMGIKSQKELKGRIDEVTKKLNELALKDVYENMGYQYDESLKSRKPTRSTLAMANSGPNTNGSQFFISLVDNDHLIGKHTVFGKVIQGMDVVDKIAQVKVGGGARPAEEVKIISIRLHLPGKGWDRADGSDKTEKAPEKKDEPKKAPEKKDEPKKDEEPEKQ